MGVNRKQKNPFAGNLKSISTEKCFLCGEVSDFIIDDRATLFREATCENCGTSKRNSDIAHAIIRAYKGRDDAVLSESIDSFKNLNIYEVSAMGKIHDLFVKLPHYICSELLDGVRKGNVKDGVRCEDLTELTFPDDTFDLVITQDVLEHVDDPVKAFYEINRVLKPGGYHIFTVPLHEGRETVTRARLKKGKIIYLKPAVFHGDPLRPKGALVYTDFGDDIVIKVDSTGMWTTILRHSEWYSPEEITFIDDKEMHNFYSDAYKNNKLLSFFKYNSVVFISKKCDWINTGERFHTSQEGPIAYEHLHRYAFASDFVLNKTVLDIACGEGYGSSLMATTAKRVVGVDISEEVISQAKMKYAHQPNLEFRYGSCLSIPSEPKIFDVVVSFETIEHLAEHERMLDEILSVMKVDGVLIISTPNKKTYSGGSGCKNKYHVKELYLENFLELLNSRFKHITVMGQRLTFSSHIWPLESSATICDFVHYTSDGLRMDSSVAAPYEAMYFIAVCTNAKSSPEIHPMRASLFTQKNDSMYTYFWKLPGELQGKDRYLESLINSWSWKITAPLRWIYRNLIRRGK